jgi:hypothetical protein
VGDAWKLYRDEMSEETREWIRDELLAASLEGFDDFLSVSMGIIARILSGDIHPEMAKEARSYLELCLTALTAKAMQEGNAKEGNGISARIAAAQKARAKLPAPVPEFTLDATAKPTAPARADIPWEDNNG